MTADRGRRGSSGFSLIELMLAAALGVLMTAAVTQLFMSNARGVALLKGQARLQESARHALHFLAGSARSAGYFGCGAASNLADSLGGTWRDNVMTDISNPIAAFDNVGDLRDVTDWDLGARQLRPGSDIVAFRRIEGRGYDLAQPFGATGELVVASAFRPNPARVAIIAGCGKAGLLRVQSIARASGRVTLAAGVDVEVLVPEGVVYGAAAGPAATVLAPVVTEVYFVARSRWANNRGEPGWSLWRKTTRADEVVSGVEDLQLMFGIDTTPDDGMDTPQRYVRAEDIGLGTIRAVQMTVKVSSVDAVAEGNRKLMRTFSQTVAVRNRWVAM